MNKRFALRSLWLALLASLTTALTALAQTPSIEERLAKAESALASAQTAGDNAWMLTCSALVLMMTGPGLALFYGGLVRKKNVLATMMQSFIMMAVITVIWGVFGYSLAFAKGTSFIGGFDYLFLKGVGASPSAYAGTIPHQTFMVFQLMFAIITPALITGAFAERMKFSAMLLFCSLWAVIVYFPLAHMVWGDGGLLNAFLGGKIPALDFAGGTVVHISSGFSALVCALYLGKRLGYPKTPFAPHSLVLSVIGACLLWVGWFGFNAGSAVAAGSLASNAFVTTHFGAAAAAIGWLVVEWLRQGKPTVLGGISGAVAGLVGITPAAGFVTPMSALAIGFIAGVVCFFSVTELKKRLGYDDSLDAFGVHGVGGFTGALLTGVFANSAVNVVFKDTNGATLPSGLLEGNAKQVFYQLVAALIAIALGMIVSFVLLKLIDLTVGVRVTGEDETAGLDISQHGEEGYNMDVDLISAVGYSYGGGGTPIVEPALRTAGVLDK
ncbi:MAG TPA: ammonium transporter [Blastocatellia bacterium]|nr:ammonium transporter [Blastocatellia bacterium]HMV86489.1 ammonium transporter [Blastocatellia bacterium]HMX28433.1 ammonium transporter [Blastocatellia bacterium]HMZ19720.1 ammonium transporter [Blastocatellia bacterium]HNG31705.1 ammonium transporter [Blastocatellia bacterium]